MIKENNPTMAFGVCQPFEKGVLGCERYRIPAMITLNNGDVLAAADNRHSHGQDAPQNLDILTAVSSDRCMSWNYSYADYFDDCKDGTESKNSASYNDSAVIQSKETGRIFIATSAFPSGCGAFKSKRGTGFIKDENGVLRLALTDKEEASDISEYKYHVGEYDGGFAKIVGADKNYTVDKELNIYLDGEPVFTKQINSDETTRQNVFFTSSDFHIFPTCYLVVRHSDDNGATWSEPHILNPFVKGEKETFYGVCPGRGAVTTVNGKERIIFCAYNIMSGVERVSSVYTDDNGKTWQRGESMKHERGLRKSSESQIISMPDGNLRIFCRNFSKLVGTAVSEDGGVTWSLLRADKNLYCTKNCMVSFINTSKYIGGKQVVLGSYACGGEERKNGVIRSGLMDEKGQIEWKSSLRLNDGFFAYSCLNELQDGTIACLFEDEPAHITLRLFEINDDCSVRPTDGVYYNEPIRQKPSAKEKIKAFFMKLTDFSAE